MNRKQLYATLILMGWRTTDDSMQLLSPATWDKQCILTFYLGSYRFISTRGPQSLDSAGMPNGYITAKGVLNICNKQTINRAAEINK